MASISKTSSRPSFGNQSPAWYKKGGRDHPIYKKLEKEVAATTYTQWIQRRGEVVVDALKKLKQGKDKKSRMFLAERLSDGVIRPVTLQGPVLKQLNEMFQAVDKRFKKIRETTKTKRKVFIGYPFLVDKLLRLIERPDLCKDIALPQINRFAETEQPAVVRNRVSSVCVQIGHHIKTRDGLFGVRFTAPIHRPYLSPRAPAHVVARESRH